MRIRRLRSRWGAALPPIAGHQVGYVGRMVPGTKVEGGVAAVGVAKVDDAGELPGRWIDEDMFRPGLECRATGSVLLGSRSIRRIAAPGRTLQPWSRPRFWFG